MPPKIAVFAGRGRLPHDVVRTLEAEGRPYLIIGFEGSTDPALLVGRPHHLTTLGAYGRTLALLAREGCDAVVFAGPVDRPRFEALRPDLRGLKVLPRIARAAAKGDDALFKALVRSFEEEGFKVVGVHELVAEDVAGEGPMGRVAPSSADLGDIARAVAVIRALGSHDVGQAVISLGGRILGIEAAEGTDALVVRTAALARPLRSATREAPRGVLVKMPKPGQERRIDMPAVGPDTVDKVSAAGFGGIAVESGGTLLIGRREAVRRADEAGIFIHGFDPAGLAR